MISVIIPTYRRYEMLCEAVRSVLTQTYCDLEIIVVDDCSNDDTRRIGELSSRIIYLCNERNSGPGYSRRRGLQCSRGEYVVFLDDDDYYTDNHFYSKAVNILQANAECNMVAANAVVLHTNDGRFAEDKLNTVGEMTASAYLKGFPYKYKKPHSTFTTVFKKSALLDVGVDQMKMVNDMAIYMRCLTAEGIVYFLEDTIGVYRIHDCNISKVMTWDFICANLEEKYSICKRIEQTQQFMEVDAWWFAQLESTVGYFIYGSQPSLKEWRDAKKWCIEHSAQSADVEKLFDKYRRYLIDVKKCRIKSLIKKVLGVE